MSFLNLNSFFKEYIEFEKTRPAVVSILVNHYSRFRTNSNVIHRSARVYPRREIRWHAFY